MWSILFCRSVKAHGLVNSRAHLTTSTAITSPRMRPRKRALAPQGWLVRQTSPYYYDASHQTAKTVRALLEQPNNPPLLTQTIESFLFSIRSGHTDDDESRAHFEALLRVHFSAFDKASLATLHSALKKQNFSCYVTEAVIDDQIYVDYGFANGPPHKKYRTLLQTADFFNLLEHHVETAVQMDQVFHHCPTLAPDWAQSARDALASCADEWALGNRSKESVYSIACQLATSLGLSSFPDAVLTVQPASRASTVDWQGSTLCVESEMAAKLAQENGSSIVTTVMRDLLELMLMKSLFGPAAELSHLSLSQQRILRYGVERVIDHCQPACKDPALRKKLAVTAAALMTNAHRFGQVQVIPGCGGALGHAWIAPNLSLIPAREQKGTLIGTRFMQTGFQVAPAEVAIREWPAQFLASHQNEDIYPTARAIQITVPVDASRLQEAATMTIKTWRENALPYRFIGTEPGMPATGCRAVVWHAVQLGMDDNARALFAIFNRGLPDPDSPTELWLRFAGLMEWLQSMAQDEDNAL